MRAGDLRFGEEPWCGGKRWRWRAWQLLGWLSRRASSWACCGGATQVRLGLWTPLTRGVGAWIWGILGWPRIDARDIFMHFEWFGYLRMSNCGCRSA